MLPPARAQVQRRRAPSLPNCLSILIPGKDNIQDRRHWTVSLQEAFFELVSCDCLGAGLPSLRSPSLSTNHEGGRGPVRPGDTVRSPGRVDHGHHAVRGPLCPAPARRHPPWGRGRHQSVPERGLPSALRGLGERALRSRPQSLWVTGLYIPGRRPQRLTPPAVCWAHRAEFPVQVTRGRVGTASS